jgi:hypothetical protein
MVLIKIYALITRCAAAYFCGIRKYENVAILIPVAILSHFLLHFTLYDLFPYYPAL